MIAFTILGRIPSKKNSKRILKRGNKRFIASQVGYTDWERITALAMSSVAKSNGWDGVTAQRCSIVLDFTFGDKRCRDLTNSAEGVMDALVKSEIISDDSWVVVPILSMNGKYKKDTWECDIKIEEIGNQMLEISESGLISAVCILYTKQQEEFDYLQSIDEVPEYVLKVECQREDERLPVHRCCFFDLNEILYGYTVYENYTCVVFRYSEPLIVRCAVDDLMNIVEKNRSQNKK